MSESEVKQAKKKPKKKKLTELSVSDNTFSDNNKSSHKKSTREKKPNLKDDLGYVETKTKCKDPKLLEVAKRCEKMMAKIKKQSVSEYFMHSNNPDIPCLHEVEKKVKSFQFSSIHIFAMEVRKVWKYYFSSAVNNLELYQKTCEISQYFEEIFTEAEENPIEGGQALENLTKKLQKIESQMQMNEKMKQQPNLQGSQSLYLSKQNSRALIPLHEKPMTITEKNLLGTNIRLLSQDQMKGIINILSDQYSSETKSKYFEFDIDTLSTKKLRDLEKYVKKCLKTKQIKELIAKPNKIEKEKLTDLKVRLYNFIIFIYRMI